jgi:hypothetical protein
MTARALLTERTLLRLTLSLCVLFLGAAAWASSGAIDVPADLPNRTDQVGLRLRWALVREPATVRAVGLAASPNRDVSWTRIALFGVDRSGRIVSRGESEVQGGLTRNTGPFEVTLRPTGEEERFELVVLRAREGKPGD